MHVPSARTLKAKFGNQYAIGAWIVVMVALLPAGAAPSFAQSRETHNVPWFQAHPQILDETLRRCHTDARLNATWDCQNAEAAGTSRMGQPLPNTFPRSGQGRTATGNDSLLEPDFNPHTNPYGYAQLKAACANRATNPTHMFLPYCDQLSRYPDGGSNGR